MALLYVSRKVSFVPVSKATSWQAILQEWREWEEAEDIWVLSADEVWEELEWYKRLSPEDQFEMGTFLF